MLEPENKHSKVSKVPPALHAGGLELVEVTYGLYAKNRLPQNVVISFAVRPLVEGQRSSLRHWQDELR